MDKTKLEEMAKKAFENARQAREQLFASTEKALAKKIILEQKEGMAFASGKFDGKNVETRKAQAREFFDADYMELATYENGERSARYHYDVSQIDVDTVKTLLRIAELP